MKCTTLSLSYEGNLGIFCVVDAMSRNLPHLFSDSNINRIVVGRNNFPTVPRSPKTPTSVSRVMAHDIAHRFTKRFSINKPCDYCCKPIIMNTGKLKAH